MQISALSQAAGMADADTIAVGLFEGEGAPRQFPSQLAELIDSGEARGSFKALALTHAEGKRWLLVGLGPREQFTAERARAAAAVACARAKELSTRTLAWQIPGEGEGQREGDGEGGHDDARAIAAALVEGTVLADYRFERFKSSAGEQDAGEAGRKQLEGVIVAGAEGLEQTVAQAGVVAEAVNRARDLQNRPGNDLTPSALGEYASALAHEVEGLSVEVQGREGIAARGMGAFAAVAQGSEQEPALITISYESPQAPAGAPTLGLVGKAVTFDSGGISLKPGAKMSEMKFDMSGGAAVIEAARAIALLKLPVKLVAVVGATENLPSGSAIKPGDIVTAANGKTIEINNTD
ncbi:MAG TPA: M17 family peptidase N-terminal domain-containing protein, partial [Solirubrobacteraceae bacterium]|nr:M17 family peptidase N-terminal domain-containing protein [Solirubrobacteraceae bacterium]